MVASGQGVGHHLDGVNVYGRDVRVPCPPVDVRRRSGQGWAGRPGTRDIARQISVEDGHPGLPAAGSGETGRWPV